jgi:pyruvate kinase
MTTDKQLVPNVPIEDYKRAKIIATVGPASSTYAQVKQLIAAGANGIRLNFSHGTHDERIEQIAWIRKAGKETGKPVAIIQDLQGPKIRLGDFDDVIPVQTGKSLQFQYGADYKETGIIPTQYDLSKKIKRGERLYIFDGKVRTTVTSVKDGIVHVRAENDGVLIKRKGMNLPDTDFGGDIITSKDKKDITFGSTQDIDYVALSFVQTADDIAQLKRMLKNLGSSAKIIAKIETKAGVENIDAIVREADAVMIARGDLAVETPPESVPIVQRRIIELGVQLGKPSIVATQMLGSMVDMPEPTRAEVSDVASAVIIGADAVMLSDETANGKYPIESVQMMKRVIRYAENSGYSMASADTTFEDKSKQTAISRSVIALADTVDARAIVAETRSGATALSIATLRPQTTVIAVTSDARTAQQLAIVHGVKSYVRPTDPMAATKLTDWLRQNKVLKKGDLVVTASGAKPGVVGGTDTIKVRMLE